MPRTCTICSHAARVRIDDEIVNGAPNRRIAARYGLTEQSVRRHKAEHLPAALAKSHEAEEVARADSLLSKLAGLTDEARRIGGKAEAAGDYRTALSGVRELVRIVELQARLAGELNEAATVQIALVNHPDWLRLQAAILRALEAHPEARYAVAGALAELEPGLEP